MKDKTAKRESRNPYNAQEGGSKALLQRQVISRPKAGSPYSTSKPTLKVETKQVQYGNQ